MHVYVQAHVMHIHVRMYVCRYVYVRTCMQNKQWVYDNILNFSGHFITPSQGFYQKRFRFFCDWDFVRCQVVTEQK